MLRQGFLHDGRRWSFGSFYKGIYRSANQLGPAALTLVTAVKGPYDDDFDPESQTIFYRYREGSPDQADNRSLRAALELQAPVIYFLGIDPGQYQVIAPAFVTEDDPTAGMVALEVGLPFKDTRGEGLVSTEDRYEFGMVRRRYHQARFRREVLRAYANRCAVCALRERDLVQASHIIRDVEPEGVAAVVNGIALCAIHHLAYDRNLMGIDPTGLVHVGERLLREKDGPMLTTGLQGFHDRAIRQPRRAEERPDPERLAIRFAEFEAVA